MPNSGNNGNYYPDACDAAYLLVTRAESIRDALDRGHVGAALYAVADLQEQLTEVATQVVAAGVAEGLTQAEMARRMNIPASYLRGAKREFANG